MMYLIDSNALALLTAGRVRDCAAAGLPPVTRCAECRYWERGIWHPMVCALQEQPTPADGFCWEGLPRSECPNDVNRGHVGGVAADVPDSEV